MTVEGMAGLPSLVPAAVELPESVAALRADVRAFVADELAAGAWNPRVDTWLSGWDERFSRELGKRGWLGMAIPVEYGGGAKGYTDYPTLGEKQAAE